MELTQEVFERYVGGQVEIKNPTYPYHYRGEISSINLSEPSQKLRNLFIYFAWCVKKDSRRRWENASPTPYTAGLSIYSASETGDGGLVLRCNVNQEVITFYPPGVRDDPRPKEEVVAASAAN